MDMEEKVRIKEEEGRTRAQQVLEVQIPWVDFNFYWTQGGRNPLDLFLTASTVMTSRTYVGDVKSYLDEEHPRDLFKYVDYMCDFEKLYRIKRRAKKDNRTPILIAVFPTYLAIWDLNKVNWESTLEWKEANKVGVEYGSKEWNLMAHLPVHHDVLIIPYNTEDLS